MVEIAWLVWLTQRVRMRKGGRVLKQHGVLRAESSQNPAGTLAESLGQLQRPVSDRGYFFAVTVGDLTRFLVE